MRDRKIIQLISANGPGASTGTASKLFALCDDGTVWFRQSDAFCAKDCWSPVNMDCEEPRSF